MYAHAWIRIRIGMLASLLVALPMSLGAQTSRLVTPADIEQVAHLTGVHLVSPTAAGSVPGRDNYADRSGKLILWVQEFPAALFSRARAQPAKTMGSIQVEPKLLHAAVSGLGDEAFDSPDGPIQHALYVRKGTRAFALTANLVPGPSGDRPALSLAQLKTLAALALSRF